LQLKLFNLNLKDNDSMALAFKIKVNMHDIDDVGVKIGIALTAFSKALYPTYSHCLESLQASGQLKSIDFDSSVEKNVECEGFQEEDNSSHWRDCVPCSKRK
jgi:hypothetical protein